MRNKLSKTIKTCEKGISSSFHMIGSRIQDANPTLTLTPKLLETSRGSAADWQHGWSCNVHKTLKVGENKYLTY